MVRFARLEAPGSTHHLISRFVNREFRLAVEGARDAYLAQVPKTLAQIDWHALAYCLMSSHTHWALIAGRAPSRAFVHPINTAFASFVNRAEGRLGPVFAHRHTAVLVDEERVAVVIAYNHNDVVRAGLVKDPADSAWSSHRAYLGLVPAPPWLDVARGLAMCGFDSSPSGRLAFHDFVLSRAHLPRDPELSGDHASEIRAKIREQAGGPVELASPVMQANGHLLYPVLHNKEGKILGRWQGKASAVAETVARVCGVTIERMWSPDRARDVVTARRLAMLVWTNYLGREQHTMSSFLRLSASAGSALIRRDNDSIAALAAEARMVAELFWEESPPQIAG